MVSEDRAAPRPHVMQEWVRWSDVDPVAIMRYNAYLRLVELGEEEWGRAAGQPLPGDATLGVWQVRRVVHLEYHRPSRLGDQLTLVTYCSHLGTTSYTLHVDVLDAACATLLVSASLVIVTTGREEGLAKTPIPSLLRTALERSLLTPAAAHAAAHARVASGA